MKKVLSLVMIGFLWSSIFSVLAIRVRAQEIVWNTNPTPLPVPLHEHASVVYNGKICVLGGSSTDGNRRNTVYFADILPDGTVGTWMENPTPLPEVREDFEAVAWNGFVYVLGGSTTGGAYLNTVLYAQIQSDGTLADWMTTTSLPTTVAGYASSVWNGRIYVIIGGWPGWKGEVYYAEINPDGSIGDWNPTTSLPAPRRAPAVAVRDDMIYVMGGQYPSVVYHSTVYYANVNPDGSVGAWSTTESLPTKIQNARAVLVDEDIYVIGGDDGFTKLDTVFGPSINPDGTIESWTPVQDSLPEPITGHACVVSEGVIYVIGGTGTDGYKDTIYYSSPPVANQPPVADFECRAPKTSFTPPILFLESEIKFDAELSYDPDGSIVGFSWDFGDGTTSTEEWVTYHTYHSTGTHTVTLTVTDDEDASGSISKDIFIHQWYWALFVEVDYMEECKPSEEVLSYVETYFRDNGIMLVMYLDDEVPFDSDGVTNDEFWAYEADYNDMGDDKASYDIFGHRNYVVDSMWKWILFGNWDAEWGAYGYTNPPVILGIGNPNCGNYIFIAKDAVDLWATKYDDAFKDEGEIVVLMHELGHSIGITKLDKPWKDPDKDGTAEDYDNVPWSVMSLPDIFQYTADPIRYSPHYWRERNMEYYYIG